MEEMIESIGNCLTGRDRETPNVLDITCMHIKRAENTMKICLFEKYLFVVYKMGVVSVIDLSTGKYHKENSLEFSIRRAILVNEFSIFLIESEDGLFHTVNRDEMIYDDKKHVAHTTLKCLPPGSQISIQRLKGELKIMALSSDIKIISFCKLNEIEEELAVDNAIYNLSIFWKGGIVVVNNQKITLLSICKPRNLLNSNSIHNLDTDINICACGDCDSSEIVQSVDYDRWLDHKLEFPTILTTDIDFSVIELKAYDEELLLISNNELYSVIDLPVDLREHVAEAMLRVEPERLNQLLNLIIFKQINLDEFMFKLQFDPSEILLNFRKLVLTSYDFFYIAEISLVHKELWPEIYNLSWAFYHTKLDVDIPKLTYMQSYLIKYLEESTYPDYREWVSSLSAKVISLSNVDSLKPLFNLGRSEYILKEVYKFLYNNQATRPEPFQNVLKSDIPKYFDAIPLRSQVRLLLLKEQLGIDLPSISLLEYAGKASFCELIGSLYSLTDIDILFSMATSTFSFQDLITLFPIPNYSNHYIQTNRILPCSTTLTKLHFGLGSFIEKIQNLIKTFVSVFYDSTVFSKNFHITLTRYLLLLGFSIHKSTKTNISESLNSINLVILKELAGFYNLKTLMINASNVKSYLWLSSLYQIQDKWSSVAKCLLLHGESCYKVLQLCSKNQLEQHEQAAIICSAFRMAKKHGEDTEIFSHTAKGCLPSELHPLLDYIVFSYQS